MHLVQTRHLKRVRSRPGYRIRNMLIQHGKALGMGDRRADAPGCQHSQLRSESASRKVSTRWVAQLKAGLVQLPIGTACSATLLTSIARSSTVFRKGTNPSSYVQVNIIKS